MRRLAGLVTAAALSILSAPEAFAQSTYGCTLLSSRAQMPSVEGKSGIFFQVTPDLQMFHGLSDPSVAQMAALSDALAALGTTLIYVPVPTKALVMREYLTSETEDFGYDPQIATTVYLDTIKRLREAGVTAVDARRAMLNSTPEEPAFFHADPRMTALGAERTATAIAEQIRATPDFDLVPQAQFATSAAGRVVLPSAMRSRLQQNCLTALPEVETVRYETAKVQSAQLTSSSSSLLTQSVRQAKIALVGTEYSAEPAINLAGFLSERTGLDVLQYAVSGGGPFAAISSYMTSPAFQSARPAYLVWEVPVYHNLGRFGDQPMRELIAAAGNTCRVPVRAQPGADANTLRVDLSALDPRLDYTLFVDSDGAAGDEARFTFARSDGLTRTKSVLRHPEQVRTGRFYMPMSGLWAEGARQVDITLNAPFGTQPRVTACFY